MHVQEGIDTRIVMDQKGWYYPVGGNDYHPVDQGPRGRWTPISGDKGFIGRGITPGIWNGDGVQTLRVTL